jgi:hypothetical protein
MSYLYLPILGLDYGMYSGTGYRCLTDSLLPLLHKHSFLAATLVNR